MLSSAGSFFWRIFARSLQFFFVRTVLLLSLEAFELSDLLSSFVVSSTSESSLSLIDLLSESSDESSFALTFVLVHEIVMSKVSFPLTSIFILPLTSRSSSLSNSIL